LFQERLVSKTVLNCNFCRL